jgi:16S rRNA (adenine1518-N6/adenine1519-N6)-dimethyltransferase
VATLLAQLAEMGIRPRKGLGQNFLVDPAHRARIVDAAELAAGDAVLEIGPGPGVLTDLLAERARLVLAVELDDRLVAFLQRRYANLPQVRVLHGNILDLDIGARMSELAGPGVGYKVVANLPYYITGAAIPHILEAQPPPDLTVLTLQREVAERIVARPPDMSLLALGVQFYAAPRIADRIPAGAFYPVPKVDSALVCLQRHPGPALPGVPAGLFFRVARAGFAQRRKQLRNSLAAGLAVPPAQAATWLVAAGVEPQRRAETLTLPEWGRLALAVAAAR